MATKTLEDIFSYFIKKNKGGINKACKEIASLLDIKRTPKYLYHIYRGTSTPSDELRSKILKLRTPKSRSIRKRYRIIIEAKSLKQFKAWQALTMDQRREALDDKVKGLL